MLLEKLHLPQSRTTSKSSLLLCIDFLSKEVSFCRCVGARIVPEESLIAAAYFSAT